MELLRAYSSMRQLCSQEVPSDPTIILAPFRALSIMFGPLYMNDCLSITFEVNSSQQPWSPLS